MKYQGNLGRASYQVHVLSFNFRTLKVKSKNGFLFLYSNKFVAFPLPNKRIVIHKSKISEKSIVYNLISEYSTN